MTGFPSRQDYELLIYTLSQRYPDIVFSSVHLYTTSPGTATVTGSIRFRSGLELRVFEIVDFVAGRISDYSYDVLREGDAGTIHSPIPKTPNWQAPFLTTCTSRRTSNTTASLLRASASRAPTCPPWSPIALPWGQACPLNHLRKTTRRQGDKEMVGRPAS